MLDLSSPYGPFDSLDALVRAASEVPIPDPEEERRLARAARDGDESARETLVRTHLRLVVDEAIRYHDTVREMSALLPRGVEGLRAAVVRFEPDRHGRFGAYAREWIRLEIRNATTGA